MSKDISVWKQAYAGGNMGERHADIPSDDILIGALCNERVGSHSCADRVLVFSSHYDASVEISFIRPTRHNPENICLAVVDDARITALAESGLDALFRLMRPTHVVFCRYWGEHYDLILSLAEAHDSAILSFLDDNLLEVPIETGQSTYAHFQDAARREVIARTISEADLFVPSTPLLAVAMKPYRSGPMAEWPIYRSVESSEFEPRLPRRLTPTVGYMGSGSHITDVETILPALIALLEKRPEVRVEFFGTIKPPAALNIFGDRVSARTKADSYGDFISRLKRLGWWVGLAPLTESSFNKTKASTKWVEYTLAGIATLATSSDVYGKPHDAGALQLSSIDDYLAAMEALLDDAAKRETLLETSRSFLLDAYNLSDHFQSLKQVLKQASELSAPRIEALRQARAEEALIQPMQSREDLGENDMNTEDAAVSS